MCSTVDGEEECVLPDEEDGMPVGEPVQCTANIFRKYTNMYFL